MPTHVLTFEQTIQTTPEQLTRAFINGSALREWLCDIATVDPRPGGRMYLAWNSGYYTAGEYTRVEPGLEVDFVWFGRDDPNRSQVMVGISAEEGSVRVKLEHALPEESQDWERVADEIKKGWDAGLENLKSVLETGRDLRFTERPMLGIFPGLLSAETAQDLGTPISSGILIEGVVDGMGAQAAGIQKNDVLVSLASKEIHGLADLGVSVSGKRAGDRVEVVVYRGARKLAFEMELSHRKLPETPTTITELVESAHRHADAGIAAIDAFANGVPDEDTGIRPTANEWSVKEILAHLVLAERYYQEFISEVLASQEHWTDDYAGNQDAPIQAVITANPRFFKMVDLLRRAIRETEGLYAALPVELEQRKGSFWRLAYNEVESPAHLEAHLGQMRQALEVIAAARG